MKIAFSVIETSTEWLSGRNYSPELNIVHPVNESSTNLGQFCVRLTRSSFDIHGVTLSSFRFFKFGIMNLKLNDEISPMQ